MAKRLSKETPQERGGGTQLGLQQTDERPLQAGRVLEDEPATPETDRWGDRKLMDRGDTRQGGAFSPGEVGEPDQAMEPDSDNPLGAQTAQGPLAQEGQGNRQSAELAELEQVEPDIDLGPKDR